MKDIPYSELNQDKRAYEIMLFRDQYGIYASQIFITCNTNMNYNIFGYQLQKFLVKFIWKSGNMLRLKELWDLRGLSQEGLA